MDNRDFHRFVSHLPLDTKDRVSVVLKGHLLVEEMLREHVSQLAHQPEYLKDARLTFHQCLCLAKAFSDSEKKSNDRLWESIEKLNALRNKFAHSLEPKDIEQKINDFIDFLSPFQNEMKTRDIEGIGALPISIFAVAMSLSAILERNTKTL